MLDRFEWISPFNLKDVLILKTNINFDPNELIIDEIEFL